MKANNGIIHVQIGKELKKEFCKKIINNDENITDVIKALISGYLGDDKKRGEK